MECRSQQIDGDKTKTVFFTTKWYLGGPTTELKRHVDRKHCDESQTATMSPAGLHTPKLTTLATAQWSKDRCRKFTRKLVYDLCIRDKEPLSFVDRDGFRNFIKREFPGYIVPDRHTIAEIADECANQSRDRVIGLLKEHIANHGIMCAAHDKWTKKRRSFIGSGLYWVSRPQWKLHVAISACSCLPVGKSARIPDLRDKLDDGYTR